MPLHDWTRIPAGLFHHFHQDWSIEIARELNRRRLPKGLFALVEQRSGPRESDGLTTGNFTVVFRERVSTMSPADGATRTALDTKRRTCLAETLSSRSRS